MAKTFEQEVKESFILWSEKTGEIMDRGWPTKVKIPMEDGEYLVLDATPGEYFSDEELFLLAKKRLEESLERGAITPEGFEYFLAEARKMFNQ